MNEGKNTEAKEKEDCETCYFRDKQDECSVPIEVAGQLSSTGHFYCPFWIEYSFLNKAKKSESKIKGMGRRRT